MYRVGNFTRVNMAGGIQSPRWAMKIVLGCRVTITPWGDEGCAWVLVTMFCCGHCNLLGYPVEKGCNGTVSVVLRLVATIRQEQFCFTVIQPACDSPPCK